MQCPLETLKMTPVSLYNTARRICARKRRSQIWFPLSPTSRSTPGGGRRIREGAPFRRLVRRSIPGTPPPDLDAAYRCQDEAIALWDDARRRLEGRLDPRAAQREVRRAAPGRPDLRARPAACQRRRDHRSAGVRAGLRRHRSRIRVPARRRMRRQTWPTGPRKPRGASCKAMFVGIEIASSPLQNINDFGPAVVASDFGNNAGLLLGRGGCRLAGARARIPCIAKHASTAWWSVAAMPRRSAADRWPRWHSPCAVTRGAAGRCAPANYVSTGAATGVHAIAVGQIGRGDLHRHRQPALRDRADDTGCIARLLGDNLRVPAARFRTIPCP